jgi:hypothetical protein
MEPTPLIHRDELVAYLFRVADIAEDVEAIRRKVLGEDDGGEEAE